MIARLAIILALVSVPTLASAKEYFGSSYLLLVPKTTTPKKLLDAMKILTKHHINADDQGVRCDVIGSVQEVIEKAEFSSFAIDAENNKIDIDKFTHALQVESLIYVDEDSLVKECDELGNKIFNDVVKNGFALVNYSPIREPLPSMTGRN